jgi:hypothetical protein
VIKVQSSEIRTEQVMKSSKYYSIAPPIKKIVVWKPSENEKYNIAPPDEKSRGPTATEMTEYLTPHLDPDLEENDSDDHDSDFPNMEMDAHFLRIYDPEYKKSSMSPEKFLKSSGKTKGYLKWREMIYWNYDEYSWDFMQPEGEGPPYEDCEDFYVWFDRMKLESLELDE